MAFKTPLQKMLDCMPCGVGLYETGPAHRTLYLNDAFFKLIDCPREAYAALPKEAVRAFLYPEDRPIYQAALRQMAKKGSADSCEYRIVLQSGALRWVQLSLSRIELEGELVDFASFRDITDAKETQLASLYAETRYRLVLENTNTAVFELNYQTGDYYSSDSFHAYALSALQPKSIFSNQGTADTVHPEDLVILQQFFADTRQHHDKTECVLRLRMQDGSYRWSRLVCVLLMDEKGRPIRAIGAVLDLNKEMEQAAVQRKLMSSLPGGVAIFRFGRPIQCLYYHQALTLHDHRTREDFQAALDSAHFVDLLVAPADRNRFRREVLQRAENGLPINVTYRYLKQGETSDMQSEWVHLTAVKIREEEHQPVYYAVMTPPPEEASLFRSLAENSTISLLVTEQQTGKIIFTNPAFRTLLQHPEDVPLAGRNFADVFAPQDAGKLQRLTTLLPDTGYREETLQSSCKKMLLIRGQKILWNGVCACAFYISDQSALQKRNESLVWLLDEIPGGIGIYEIHQDRLTPLYLNKGFSRMRRKSHSPVSPFHEKNAAHALHPDDRRLFDDAAANISRGVRHIDLTYRMLNKSQTYTWFRLIGNVNTQENGQAVICCSYFNVDRQMTTQIELDNDRALLHLAMSSAKIAAWEYNQLTRQLVQSEESQQQTGLPGVIEDMPESLIRSGFVHPDNVDAYRALYMTPANRDEPTVQGDVHVKSTDNTGFLWKRVVLTHLFDSFGHYLKTVGTSMDITKEKESELSYQLLLHDLMGASSSNLIGKGRFNATKNRNEYFAPGCDEAVPIVPGTDFEQTIAKVAQQAVVPEQGDRLISAFNCRQLCEQFRKGNPVCAVEYLRRWQNSPATWVRTRCTLTTEPKTGDVVGFIYTSDITDEKLSQELIDTVIRLNYDYFALLDCRTHSYLLYGEEAAKKSPLPPARSLDYEKSIAAHAKAYLPPETVPQILQELSLSNIRTQLEKNDAFSCFFSMREPDGSYSRKKMQFSYIDKGSEKVLITRADITDLFTQEQQRLSELQAAAEIAHKASSSKSDFLSHMSHDLRTPMNAIIGLSELAKDELGDPAAMEGYITNIKSAGQFLLGLVNDCLDFEKLSSHKMQLHPTVYTYREFRNNILTIIEPLCRQKQIAFSFSTAVPHTVYIDKIRFEQIFFNLLSNAVKYTPCGGRVEFIVNSVLSDDNTMLACDFIVRDNGIGMSEEFQTHLFEPFVQEVTDTHRLQEGTGLGLSIVKELVELMGGSIAIYSEQHVGTEVTVHLDMRNVPDSAVARAARTESSFNRLAGQKVLLLEDQPLNMMIARRLLEKKGMQVTCAENGRRGLQLFAESAPGTYAAVLTDVRMPVMTGLEAARAIRALPRPDAQTVPILAMTANAFEEDMEASQQAGMNAHLSKPIDPELLYRTLEKWIFPEP